VTSGNHWRAERNASSIGLVKAALRPSMGSTSMAPTRDGTLLSCNIPQPPVMRLRRALQALAAAGSRRARR